MEDKLNILTEKIYSEGITKAKEEAKTIIEQANKKAEEIISKANIKAEEIINSALLKEKNTKQNTITEIRNTSQQAISKLKREISSLLLNGAIHQGIKASVEKKQFWSQLVSGLVSLWSEKGVLDEYKVIFSEKDKDLIEKQLVLDFQEQLKGINPIKFSNRLENGFSIEATKEGYVINFTEKDLELFLQTFLKSTTSKLLFGDHE
ncbi:MAG: hypothetical protein ACEPOW_06535 [Bacteroidales bacterium]